MKYRWLAALVFCVRLSSLGQTVDPTRINGPALELIHEATAAARTHFYVYEGSDSGLNHGFPSGLFAHPLSALSKIHLDTACVADPSSPSGCTTDPDRLDRVRGTVMRVSFDPLSPGEFAGVNIEEPENWGVHQTGGGYDLRGATRVCFDAMSPTPASKVQFAVGGRTTSFLAIPSTWTPLCFDLGALGASSAILSEVHLLFAIATNDTNAPGGVTVLLDNVRFEPVPDQQQLAVSFPIANGVLGVLPAADVLPGRVAIPPDQILPNLTTIYESSLAVIALLGRGSAQDLESARVILDAFVYAADHDNQGLSLPESGEWRGLHSAYSSGDLALFNDQGPGAGKKGQIRFAGFSIASGLCGPSHFCLVLDGSTGGNVAFAMFALEAGYQRFRDPRYLETARVLGNWIHSALLDTSGTGFGGYFLGYPDEGAAKSLLTGKSIENVADIFRAFSTLSDICTRLGLAAEAQEWNRRAKIAGDFVMAMFDDVDGRFYAGTVPPTVSPSPGIQPDGPVQGADVVNTFDFLDAQTFTTLPLASSPLYRNAIDWRRPIQWMLDHQATTVTVNGQQFHGFSLTASPTAGPNGIAWEFTGQAVVAMRFVDALYGEQRFAAQAQFYLDEIHKAQQLAPFGDGKGLPAATMEQGDLLPPREQCLSTPFQCIAQRVGLAATTWAIFADLDLNPLPTLAGTATQFTSSACSRTACGF